MLVVTLISAVGNVLIWNDAHFLPTRTRSNSCGSTLPCPPARPGSSTVHVVSVELELDWFFAFRGVNPVVDPPLERCFTHNHVKHVPLRLLNLVSIRQYVELEPPEKSRPVRQQDRTPLPTRE